jgi:LPXTG-motif cell wall-anchored protein
MKSLVIPMALLLALSVPALAQTRSGGGGTPTPSVRGAPGPLVGAGLPLLLIGGGVYWLVRRRKRAS